MGQQESKQRLDRIEQSLNRIRKDLRSGKITTNDASRIEGVLGRYATEVDEIKRVKNVRPQAITKIERLLETTSLELDSLVQEVSVDAVSIKSNSFKRSSSKNNSKKQNSTKVIKSEVQKLRQRIQNTNLEQQDYEQMQRTLVNYSQELSKNKNKSEVDTIQKLISSVTQELLTKQENGGTAPASRRSSVKSEKRSSIAEKRSSLRERKEMPKLASKQSPSTLDDIETKLDDLKDDISVAGNNKDKNRLRFLSKSIQTLMTDLQMVDVGDNILNEERKELLEKNLQRVYQEVEKIKRQLTEESDLQYLAELHQKEKKEKSLQDLEGIQDSLEALGREVNSQNFQAEKETFMKYKNQFNSIEETDQDLALKKAEVCDVMLNVENAFTRIEMEERLNQAEYRHFQYKIDLTKFSETTQDGTYNKHREYLLQLRDYVSKILEINQKIDDKKKYVLYNIDNNIAALDLKAKENEETFKKPNEEARKTYIPKTATELGDNLVTLSKELKNYTQDDLKRILPLLNEAKSLIEKEVNKFQKPVKTAPDLVIVKEKQEPVVNTVSQNTLPLSELHKSLPDDEFHRFPPVLIPEVVKEHPVATITLLNKSKRLPDEEINIIPPVIIPEAVKERHVRNTNFQTTSSSIEEINKFPPVTVPDANLVIVQEKQQPLFNIVTQTQIDNILKEVPVIRTQVNNIQPLEIQTEDSSTESGDGENFANYEARRTFRGNENLSKPADLFSENKITNRRSTTEEILVDIMSISTRVNELGNKIQSYNHTIQDYDSIEQSLLEHQRYLMNLQIAPSRSNLFKSRNDVVQQIDIYLRQLEKVKKHGDTSGSQEEKQFNQEIRKLKEKVQRYSGTYKNVLYKTIEGDIDKYLNKVDVVFTDSNVANKVKDDLEKTKMILEQKSTKEQEYVKREARPNKELVEIRQDVENVQKELSQSKPLSKEDLDKLDARLTLSILALDNIRDDHCSEEKEKLYQDIHLNFQKIQQFMLLCKPKSSHRERLDEKQSVADIIASIQRDLDEIRPKIMTFVGTETSPNFLHLDEILVRGTLKLDELSLDQASELYQLKVKLMRDIHEFSDVLDERINQTEEIEIYEKDVKTILMKIDSFNGYSGDPEYTYLDEEIIRVKVNLGKLQVVPELVSRKEVCIKEITTCMRRLNEVAKSRSDVLTGTLV